MQQQKQAISATVTGNDQRVGFRAMVMKQAIEYNLAGVAKNDANDIVHFTLQGDADRIGTGRRGCSRRNQKIVQYNGQYGAGRGGFRV